MPPVLSLTESPVATVLSNSKMLVQPLGQFLLELQVHGFLLSAVVVVVHLGMQVVVVRAVLLKQLVIPFLEP